MTASLADRLPEAGWYVRCPCCGWPQRTKRLLRPGEECLSCDAPLKGTPAQPSHRWSDLLKVAREMRTAAHGRRCLRCYERGSNANFFAPCPGSPAPIAVDRGDEP